MRSNSKIKAADIARDLNLSKATVSLVLNEKPGIGDKTRQRVLNYIAEMTGQAIYPEEAGERKIIKVIYIDNDLHFIRDSELRVCPDTQLVFDRETRRMGYILSITYVDPEKSADIKRTIKETNKENVAGVILFATEMQTEQFVPFKEINKPMVVYDNDPGREYSCVVSDGLEGVCACVDELVQRGYHEICYLANSRNIYNFQQRRSGFYTGLQKNGLKQNQYSMMELGKTTDEIYEKFLAYLNSSAMSDEKLPEAFVMENYQVSVGVIRALRQKNISVPEEVALVGIDELPEYLTGDIRMTALRIEHLERAHMAMVLLEQMIKGNISGVFRTYSGCQIIEGKTVRKVK